MGHPRPVVLFLVFYRPLVLRLCHLLYRTPPSGGTPPQGPIP
jgi:hypothetical protein